MFLPERIPRTEELDGLVYSLLILCFPIKHPYTIKNKQTSKNNKKQYIDHRESISNHRLDDKKKSFSNHNAIRLLVEINNKSFVNDYVNRNINDHFD